MFDKTDFLRQADALAEKRKHEIRDTEDKAEIAGAVYYVSSDGDDTASGLSAESAWRTLKRVSKADLQPGDGVLFRRADIFRGMVAAKPGVTYGAYGDGEKPRLYGWYKGLAEPGLWTLADDKHNIWRLTEKILDPGTLVFNDGEAHSRKLIPSYLNGRFVCRNDEAREFVMADEMTND